MKRVSDQCIEREESHFSDFLWAIAPDDKAESRPQGLQSQQR